MADASSIESSPATDRGERDHPVTDAAAQWLADLERRFRPRRADLLEARAERLRPERQPHNDWPGPLEHTAAVRAGRWQVAPSTSDLTASTRVPIRDWHATEPRVTVDGQPMAASLFDVGLTLLATSLEACTDGSLPWFSLPVVDGHLEARLWNDVICHCQDRLGIERGSVKASAAIGTMAGAFEMHEILYELREHSAGLELGGHDSSEAWAALLIDVCHRRAAPALVPDSVGATPPERREWSDAEMTALLDAAFHEIPEQQSA